MSNNYTKWLKFREGLSVAESEFMQTVKNINPGISETGGVCGIWSPKEVVAHITGWEKEVLKQFRNFLTGTATNVKYNINAYNRESVKSRQHLSWSETVKELEEAQKELQLLNNSLDEDKINNQKKIC
ncbi:hypothetical protein JXQ31_17435 [candidate division KSB1 bacterium]|nr:hypothetical protein [candidate division KSB1 bacterium]